MNEVTRILLVFHEVPFHLVVNMHVYEALYGLKHKLLKVNVNLHSGVEKCSDLSFLPH